MAAETMEREDVDELDRFGDQISEAYRLSGEPPSRAAIDWIDQQVELPSRFDTEAARQRFLDGLRQRMQSALQELTGASTLGEFIQGARKDSGVTETDAAKRAGLALPAYRQIEAGRMPIWRTPAAPFAKFCYSVHLDTSVLLRWASLQLGTGPAFGRVDLTGDARTKVLEHLGQDAGATTSHEFDQWRKSFIDAFGSASKGGAPSIR